MACEFCTTDGPFYTRAEVEQAVMREREECAAAARPFGDERYFSEASNRILERHKPNIDELVADKGGDANSGNRSESPDIAEAGAEACGRSEPITHIGSASGAQAGESAHVGKPEPAPASSSPSEEWQLFVAGERAKQDRKWGEQNHNDIKWLAVLVEEVGEIAQAILKDDMSATVEEMIQSSAVLQAWYEAIRRRPLGSVSGQGVAQPSAIPAQAAEPTERHRGFREWHQGPLETCPECPGTLLHREPPERLHVHISGPLRRPGQPTCPPCFDAGLLKAARMAREMAEVTGLSRKTCLAIADQLEAKVKGGKSDARA